MQRFDKQNTFIMTTAEDSGAGPRWTVTLTRPIDRSHDLPCTLCHSCTVCRTHWAPGSNRMPLSLCLGSSDGLPAKTPSFLHPPPCTPPPHTHLHPPPPPPLPIPPSTNPSNPGSLGARHLCFSRKMQETIPRPDLTTSPRLPAFLSLRTVGFTCTKGINRGGQQCGWLLQREEKKRSALIICWARET